MAMRFTTRPDSDRLRTIGFLLRKKGPGSFIQLHQQDSVGALEISGTRLEMPLMTSMEATGRQQTGVGIALTIWRQ